MGDSLSLLAIECDEVDDALGMIGIERTGTHCEYALEPLSGCTLPGGAYLVVATRCDAAFLGADVLAQLSTRFPVTACSIEEHVMFSSAEVWIDGARAWRVAHTGESEPVDLEVIGVMPPEFHAMADALKAQQEADGGASAGVDHYFDIPLLAAKARTGFKHDEEIAGIDYAHFDRLLAPGSSRPWWRLRR